MITYIYNIYIYIETKLVTFGPSLRYSEPGSQAPDDSCAMKALKSASCTTQGGNRGHTTGQRAVHFMAKNEETS